MSLHFCITHCYSHNAIVTFFFQTLLQKVLFFPPYCLSTKMSTFLVYHIEHNHIKSLQIKIVPAIL